MGRVVLEPMKSILTGVDQYFSGEIGKRPQRGLELECGGRLSKS